MTIEQSTGSELNSDPTEFKVEWVKISLPAVITLSQLNELKTELQQYLGNRVQLYGDQVKRVDTASLQLLLAFINDPEITVGWMRPSEELCTSARLLGLSNQLGLPLISPSV